MTLVFVRVIQAIVVAVTNVNSRNAIAVVAREQIAEACPTLGLAITGWLVASVQTVVVSVTVPCGRNTSVIGTAEAVLRTGPLSAMNRIFIAIVAAIVVAVAEPVGLYTDVRLLTFEMIQRARSIARASLVRLVRSNIVLAVINAVAHLRLRDAAVVGAGEFSWRAWWIHAAFLIATVSTIVFVIALPRFENTPAVVATELVRTA